MILLKDLGTRYETPTAKRKRRFGLYACTNCAQPFEARMDGIARGNNKYCAECRNTGKTTHGMSKHLLYNTWKKQKRRCTNPKDKDYVNYGEKGITFHNSFLNIAKWIEYVERLPNAYRKGYTIDRINNSGNYAPNNLRWASKCIQSQNSTVLRSNNTSGYRGVHRNGSKWRAVIDNNNARYILGYFDTKQEAADTYDAFIKHHKTYHNGNGEINERNNKK